MQLSTADTKFQNEELIDLRAYFRIVNLYKWRIFTFATMVTLIVAVVTFALTPKYRATATMLLEAEHVKAVSIEEVYGLDSSRKEYLQTQYEILRSRRLAENVIERLSLLQHAEFQRKPLNSIQLYIQSLKDMLPVERDVVEISDEERLEREKRRVVSIFLQRLSISAVPKTQLVRISFEAESPSLAAKVANALGDEYIASHLEDKVIATTKASQWIRERLEGLRIRLRESEAELQNFREQEGLVDIEGVVALASRELNEITSQLTKARQTRSQMEALMRVLDSRDKENLSELESLPEISEHRWIQEAKRAEGIAEQRVAELSKRYGPKHNKMKAAQAQLVEARANLNRQVGKLIKGIEQEVSTSRDNEVALVSELAKAKARYQVLTRTEANYRELSREVDSNRRLHETFLNRLKETGAVGDFNTAHARFTDRAVKPGSPAKPNRKMIIAAAFIASLGLAVLMAFLIHGLSDMISSPEDVESYLSQRIVGVIPRVKVKKKGNVRTHAFFDGDMQSFSEAWRTLRTGLVLSHLDSPSKVIAVTSTLPNEGKTTTAINTAFALGQVERVLLLDADIRKPSICRRFGIPNYQPGVTNLLTGTHSLDQCIYHDETSGVDILVAGSPMPNPLELLAKPEFEELINKLRGLYDRVVIDTPPSRVVSDALVVAKQADSTLYVVRAAQVRRSIILESIGRLQRLEVRVDGIVLNAIHKRDSKEIYDYNYGDVYGSNAYQQPESSTKNITGT
ncbi:chain-length determining protein [Corallincola holothuriorum]|uniref:non-specific protein-tyrosine kinase n=1 Tax=Corallincola holothuriorum TaxID=2282215 RepID=A0A368NFY7_9GAMM|nr:polysaccharide biosynthesis tyrosine autokinase [Corallincola holothuriorum]RCU49472.1 chain-length determining protein [Corallincola holothuriorum]